MVLTRVQELLTAGGFGTPLAWAYAFVDEAAEEWEQAAVDCAEGLCGLLPEDGWLHLSSELLAPASASAQATVSHGTRVAAVSDLQLSVDEADAVRLGATAADESDLHHVQVYNPDGEIPWLGVWSSTGVER